ncbi:MAG: hypothetical protein AAGJ54_04395 [Planctomycetota bacterium]
MFSRFTAVAALALAPLAAAGPLTPPAGAVSPTNKTLQEVEPRIPISRANTTITEPGSYYLTNNIDMQGFSGIRVAASSVTIDLNGFTIFSTTTGGNGDCITANFDADLQNITIRNGKLVRPNRFQIYMLAADNVTVEDVEFVQGTNYALSADNGLTVRRCSFDRTSGGILTDDRLRVEDCSFDQVQRNPIVCDNSAVIDRVEISNGPNGIRAGSGFTLRDSSMREIDGEAVSCLASSRIENVTLDGIGSDATDIALEVGSDSKVSSCLIRRVIGTAISASTLATVEDTQVSGITGLGVSVSSDSAIQRCSVNSASLGAITTGSRSVVRDSAVVIAANSIGIDVGADCEVTNCFIDAFSNTGTTGIDATLSDVRIVSNTFSDCNIAIELGATTTSDRFVVKNSFMSCIVPINGSGPGVALVQSGGDAFAASAWSNIDVP